MALLISRSQSRIVERIDIRLGAATLGLVEGAQVESPLTFGLNLPDHFSFLEPMSLEDVEQLGAEITAFAERIRANRVVAEEPVVTETTTETTTTR